MFSRGKKDTVGQDHYEIDTCDQVTVLGHRENFSHPARSTVWIFKFSASRF